MSDAIFYFLGFFIMYGLLSFIYDIFKSLKHYMKKR